MYICYGLVAKVDSVHFNSFRTQLYMTCKLTVGKLEAKTITLVFEE